MKGTKHAGTTRITLLVRWFGSAIYYRLHNHGSTVMDYDEQAKKFLENTNTTLSMVRYPMYLKPEANWKNSGVCYKVTLTRKDQKYTFNFWDSLDNLRKHSKPTNYDILACLDDYVDTSISIDEFADEYGYTKISDAIKIYNDCLQQTFALRKMFSESELTTLREIQ